MNIDWISLIVGIIMGAVAMFFINIARKKAVAHSTISIEAIIHELKTPLTGLSWIFNSLDELETGTVIKEETISLLKEASKKVGNSIELADDALLALDTSADYATYKFEEHELADVIKKVIEENSFTAREKFVTLSYAKIGDVPAFSFDEIKITLAIRNLVNNAVKYSPSHSSVEVALSRNNNDAVISVSDKGIGIPKDDISRVTNKFFRAGNIGDTTGSGLGLFIVKNIISGHRGRLDIQSREGIGTKITIFLPIR